MIQVDVRGEQIGRRVPVDVALVGTVKDTIDALLPMITVKTDSAHLDRMTAHYRRARARLDRLAESAGAGRRCTRSSSPRRSTGSLPTTRSSPRTSARRASGPPATCT